MSAYAVFEGVPFVDVDCLVDALKESFGGVEVAEGDQGLPLMGFKGDDRSKLAPSDPNYAAPARVRIARKHIGSLSNDIGFVEQDGKLVPVISEYDSSRFDQCWMNKLRADYLERYVNKNAAAQGYRVKQTVQADGKIRMVCTRYR